ncbi:hypothetical protein KI655_10350 [Vibrio sp. D404a]|uniref:polysialyltransferase family glycosyltransferase n=1 Tax=unclassified Vibrio TaxID=2614977 RepID=UPI002554CD28|nr:MULTISPECIES: polysialyltransferase family glycosyltransferase [unclassified Vibrio]MDK9737703.1 hypothetical protein [Vibrio sp. D404a]MDK9795305.1 hypothetical protein [Vibrio sp. D449a]
MKNVHLCITYAHLLLALSETIRDGDIEHVIFMPIDFQYVSPRLRRRLKESFPNIRFVFIKEAYFIRSFSGGGAFLPGVIRRNISFKKGYIITPFTWKLYNYFDQSFDKFYCYHSGPFLAKVLAGHSQNTTLRVDGFASYQFQKVTFLKGMVRLVFGLSPKRQIWGEEKWVDAVEAPEPDMIPCSLVRQKTRQVFDVFNILREETIKSKLMWCFGVSETYYSKANQQALLLTQPISEAGLCSLEFKHALYQSLLEKLKNKGLDVIVKRHPKEIDVMPLGCPELPLDFPVELLHLLGVRFKVGVALNTAALNTNTPIAQQHMQLIPLEHFYAHCTSMWNDLIAKKLKMLN